MPRSLLTLLRAVPIFLLCACTSQPLDGGSCDELNAEIQQWLDAHRSCQVDSDCAYAHTACGLPGECGDPANKQAQGAYLDGLVAQWEQQCGSGNHCECPFLPLVGCVSGTCAVKLGR
jgi:hypothetical protein